MAFSTPGTYVLYRWPDPRLAPWPAVVCTDDMAPEQVQAQKPHGFYSLVLLLGDKFEFRYALASDMMEWNLACDFGEPNRASGLKEAYNHVKFATEAGLGLNFWVSQIEERRQLQPSPMPPPLPDPIQGFDYDYDSDHDLREAMRRSLADVGGKHQEPLPTPSLSPPSLKRKSSEPLESPAVRRPNKDIRIFLPPSESSITNQSPLPSSSQLKGNPISLRSGDIVEGDIADSEHYVEFVVGREGKAFRIPKSAVDCRTYFRSVHHDYFRAKGDKTWAVEMPRLKEIDPEDFVFVAEFLESGDFGLRVIDDEQREILMRQCVAAWEAGALLGMVDLLELIVSKVENAMPWTVAEVLSFAIIVYRTVDNLVDAHTQMKGKLTEYIANNFYEFLEDHFQVFTNRIKLLPELDRDIHQKMADKANERC